MRFIFVVPLALSLAVGAPVPATAQPPDSIPGSDLTIALVTVAPGDRMWERFGHNAIWVRDASGSIDRAYNYGLFSFEQENFLAQFIQGRMVYWMTGFEAESHLAAYMAADRSVWVQELNLTPAQRVAMRDFLAWNDRPENRFYRYHYYRDNCSTRVRDAIDRVVDGRIRAQTDTTPSGTTFRFHTLRSATNNIFLFTGLDMGLAQPVDRPISVWEEMFMPLALRDHLREITRPGPDGEPVPLVASERTLFVGHSTPVRDAPPSWLLGYLGVGVVLASLLGWLGYRAPRSVRARWSFAGIGALWWFLIGVSGVVLVWLWAFTNHDTSYRNENLFFFTPLALPLAALLPLGMARLGRARVAADWLSVAVGGMALLGWTLKLLPAFYQVNGELIALTLPVHGVVVVMTLRFFHHSPNASRLPSTVQMSASRST